ncbi:hypothetical protein CEXT_771771 [Caerostris extrusa]|uniref:Uncharacterized protein n=1 Tax=Caerostris extrusa TaxID=172846 RepID=A0AAV4YDQ3_CAEEX|nr:hypothetical protein CEXT_771771 [Caerostris extrusa]
MNNTHPYPINSTSNGSLWFTQNQSSQSQTPSSFCQQINQQNQTSNVDHIQLKPIHEKYHTQYSETGFPKNRFPSSIKSIFNQFEIFNTNQYVSFSFTRELQYRTSQKIPKVSIYQIAIKIITVRSNGHERNMNNNRK